MIVACNIFCHIRHNLQIPCLNDINQQNDKNNESFGFFFFNFQQFVDVYGFWVYIFMIKSVHFFSTWCWVELQNLITSIYTLNTFSGKQFKVVMDLYHCMVSVIDLNRKTIQNLSTFFKVLNDIYVTAVYFSLITGTYSNNHGPCMRALNYIFLFPIYRFFSTLIYIIIII